MSFPRYPKYKASGVEWPGDVPEGWGVKPLRYLSSVRKGKLPSATFPNSTSETDLPYLSMEYLRSEFECVDYVAASINIVCAEAGDILLLWDGSNAGEFLRAKQGAVSSTTALIEPKNIQKEFLFFACKAREHELKDQTIGMGIPHVSGDKLKSIKIPYPPLPEQTAIAEFLDRETAKIDELVAEQRRLMELLKEKRQAVISHAVTKGLNPHAPMKPSGIDWLGDVPAGWEIKRLKHISPFIAVGIVVNPSNYIADEGLPFIYGGDIREGVIDFANARRITRESSEINSKTLLRTGDLLTVRVGAPGVTAVVPSECDGGNCASVMLIRQGTYNSHWLCYAMNTRIVRFQVEVVKYGAAQEQFNIGHAVNFWVPVPPCTVQDEIAEFLAIETARFDALTAAAQQAIDLLQERRTALISAAVTGQIDVRQQTQH